MHVLQRESNEENRQSPANGNTATVLSRRKQLNLQSLANNSTAKKDIQIIMAESQQTQVIDLMLV